MGKSGEFFHGRVEMRKRRTAMGQLLVLSQKLVKADVLALFLEFSGHECEVAGSVTEAIRLLSQKSFDAVVADYSQPDSLSKMAQYLKNAPRRIPLVALANGVPKARKGSSKVPLEANPDQLLQAVDRIVRRKPARRHTARPAPGRIAAA